MATPATAVTGTSMRAEYQTSRYTKSWVPALTRTPPSSKATSVACTRPTRDRQYELAKKSTRGVAATVVARRDGGRTCAKVNCFIVLTNSPL